MVLPCFCHRRFEPLGPRGRGHHTPLVPGPLRLSACQPPALAEPPLGSAQGTPSRLSSPGVPAPPGQGHLHGALFRFCLRTGWGPVPSSPRSCSSGLPPPPSRQDSPCRGASSLGTQPPRVQDDAAALGKKERRERLQQGSWTRALPSARRTAALHLHGPAARVPHARPQSALSTHATWPRVRFRQFKP